MYKAGTSEICSKIGNQDCSNYQHEWNSYYHSQSIPMSVVQLASKSEVVLAAEFSYNAFQPVIFGLPYSMLILKRIKAFSWFCLIGRHDCNQNKGT